MITDHPYQAGFAGGLCDYVTWPEGTSPGTALCNRPGAMHADPKPERVLGEATTLELLEELRLRGELAMTAMPTTERGADGAALSALAGVLLKSSTKQTLEAIRGK